MKKSERKNFDRRYKRSLKPKRYVNYLGFDDFMKNSRTGQDFIAAAREFIYREPIFMNRKYFE